MAVKDAVSAYYPDLIECFDGLTRLNYPLGDMPSGYQTSPRIVWMDKSSGSTVNHRDNKGSCVTIVGYGFGRKADLSLPEGLQMFFRDPAGDNAWHQVDNYKLLLKSKTYVVNQLQYCTVQIGALGGIANGALCDAKIRVNGVDSPILEECFTVQPSNGYWVSKAGNDATGVVNDPTHPYRYFQSYSGSTPLGIWAVWVPGDAIYGIGDEDDPFTDQVGFDNNWVRPRAETGTAPNGTVGNGQYTIEADPGGVLAHNPYRVKIHVPAGGGGGLVGPGSSRASEGAGKRFSLINMWVEIDAEAESDAAPVNWQAGADYWMIFHSELGPWPSTLVSPDNAKAGGVAGSAKHAKVIACHVHDIDCDKNNPTTSALENHGMYNDGEAHDGVSDDVEVAYCWFHRIPGGSLIQWQDLTGGVYTNHKLHHCVLWESAKYGLNFAPGAVTVDTYNNTIGRCGRNAIRVLHDFVAETVIRVVHTTILQRASVSAFKTAITGEYSDMTLGSFVFKNNITYLEAAASAGLEPTNYSDIGDITALVDSWDCGSNLYFDYDGVDVDPPTMDPSSDYGDPKFTDLANLNFTVKSDGAGRNGGTTSLGITVSDDLFGVVRDGTPDIGCMEGVGT